MTWRERKYIAFDAVIVPTVSPTESLFRRKSLAHFWNLARDTAQGGKKTRGFKPRDPKIYPPSWCPKLKCPVEYRIYAYKDVNAWYLHRLLQAKGLLNTPNGHEFAVRSDGHTALSARNFWKEVKFKSASEVLGVPIYDDEVIEIDDGLRPCFFHMKMGQSRCFFVFRVIRPVKISMWSKLRQRRMNEIQVGLNDVRKGVLRNDKRLAGLPCVPGSTERTVLPLFCNVGRCRF